MTPSDLWKVNSQMSPLIYTLSPSPLFLQIWNIKGPESPPAFNTRVKRSTICEILKMEPREGNLSLLEPDSSQIQRAVTSRRQH